MIEPARRDAARIGKNGATPVGREFSRARTLAVEQLTPATTLTDVSGKKWSQLTCPAEYLQLHR